MMRQSDENNSGNSGPSVWARYAEWMVLGVFHLAMGGVVGAAAIVLMFDSQSLQAMSGAAMSGPYQPDWSGLAGLFAASLVLWACMWMAGRHLWSRFRGRGATDGARPAEAAGRGAVLTETLIVLVPFLLLTSGVSQVAMNQSASIMAHYAAYQSARTHWIWHDEVGSLRGSGTNYGDRATETRIRNKSRMAAALALAPSSTGSIAYDPGDGDLLRNVQNVMRSSFSSSTGFGGIGAFSGIAATGRGENLSFSRALGGSPFPTRALRRLGFAYMSLEDSFQLLHEDFGGRERVGIRFTYPMQQTFPWFAWIHSGSDSVSGCSQSVAGRVGCYVGIEREMFYAKQSNLYSNP